MMLQKCTSHEDKTHSQQIGAAAAKTKKTKHLLASDSGNPNVPQLRICRSHRTRRTDPEGKIGGKQSPVRMLAIH